MQAAIDVSGLGDTSVDPAEVASYHFKLGRLLWETKAKGCATPTSSHAPDAFGPCFGHSVSSSHPLSC